MRTTLAIARKELSIYFTTPLAYFFMFLLVAVAAFFFVGHLQTFKEVQEMARQNTWPLLLRTNPEVEPYKNLTDGVVLQLWGVILFVTLIIAPFLSMRLLAEEKRSKTYELLMTAPVRPVEIVVGKYLGGLGVISVTLALTLVFPLLLAAFGSSESGHALEWSTVLLGYGALLLWGATCIAVGLFISSVTDSQMLAGVVTLVLLLLWWLLNFLVQGSEEPLRTVVTQLALNTQLGGLMKGVLDLKALVFFSSIILFSLMLTHRSVEAQRWT